VQVGNCRWLWYNKKCAESASDCTLAVYSPPLGVCCRLAEQLMVAYGRQHAVTCGILQPEPAFTYQREVAPSWERQRPVRTWVPPVASRGC